MEIKVNMERFINTRPVKYFNNCQVLDLDPLGVGLTILPRAIEVQLPDTDGAPMLAEFNGGIPNLIIGDIVRVRRDGTDGIYTVAGLGGASGTQVGSGNMFWKNQWIAGTYDPYDTVRDNDWGMVANKLTTDRPAPQPTGDPFWQLPDVPAWNVNNITDYVISGIRVSNLPGLFSIYRVRIWVQDISPNASYRLITIDNITGETNVGEQFLGSVAIVPQWVVAVKSGHLLPGDDVTIGVITENSSATTDFNWPWQYIGSSNQEIDPGLGNIGNRGDQQVLRINTEDDDGTDRSGDLASVIPGSTIKIANEADLNAFYEYQVVSNTNNTTWHSYAVTLAATGVNGPPLQLRSTVSFSVPVPTPTDYVDLPNHFVGSTAIQGFLQLGDAPSVTNDNGYGIDIEVQEYITSADWDLLSIIGGGATSTGGGVDNFIALIDTPSSYASQRGQAVTVRADELGLEYTVSGAIIGEAKPTGLVNGGELNIDSGVNVEVIAGLGVVIDSYTDPDALPTRTTISWSDQIEAIVGGAPTAGDIVYFTMAIGVGDGPVAGSTVGALQQYISNPGQATVRDEIFLGYVIYNGSTWGEVSSPIVVNNAAHTLNEYITRVQGPSFILSGGEVTEAALFTLDRAAGEVWERNRNWHINKKDPNTESFLATPNMQWRYVNRDFSDTGVLGGTVDASMWDNAGIVEAVGGAAQRTTIQRVFVDPRDNFWVLWGQNVWDTYDEALGQLGVDEANTIVPELLGASVLIGYVVTQQNKIDWQDEQARFVSTIEAIGGGGGGGGGSLWASDINGINYQSGNVGIGGDSDATDKLKVQHSNSALLELANITASNIANLVNVNFRLNSSTSERTFARVVAGATNVNDGTRAGLIKFAVALDGPLVDRMLITSTMIGIGTDFSDAGDNADFSIVSSAGVANISAKQVSDTTAASINLKRGRVGDALLQSGDDVAQLNFRSSNGAGGYNVTARIRVSANGVQTVSSLPGNMTFWTTPVGATAPTQRFTIFPEGHVGVTVTDVAAFLDDEDFQVQGRGNIAAMAVSGNTSAKIFLRAGAFNHTFNGGSSGLGAFQFDTTGARWYWTKNNSGLQFTEIEYSGGGVISRLYRTDANQPASTEYLTTGVLNWSSGATDGSIAGNGTQFFIGQNVGGADPAFWIENTGQINFGAETVTNGQMTQSGLNISKSVGEEALTFRMIGLAHGVTNLAATDTAGAIRANLNGNLVIRGLAQTGTALGIQMEGITTDSNSNTGVSALGAITMKAAKKNGTSVTVFASGENIFLVRNNTTTRMIVKGNGDIYSGGGSATTTMVTKFDGENDAHLLRAFDTIRGGAGIIKSEWDKFVKYNEQDLIKFGILGDTIANGGLTNITQLQRLLSGAVWQAHTRISELENKIKLLEAN